MDPTAVRAAIRDRALAGGFDAVGFASADDDGTLRERLVDFLAQGLHGDMGWMETRVDQRASPRGLWDAANTVIALGVNYGPDGDALATTHQRDRGNISVYARNRDYHDLIKGRLKQLASWIHHRFQADVKVFVDTAPVMEKPLAERAGLGWRGKHTNLVSREFGSWLFLGEIYTTLALPADPGGVDRCGTCERCLTACPTNAFLGARRLDARRCISYLTIEHAGPIPEDLRPLIGNRIYGCDDCLAVCPWNRFAKATVEAAFLPREGLTAPKLIDLARLDDAGFRALFTASPVKRIGRDRFVRNVLVAIGNGGDPAARAVVTTLLDDAAEVVRDAARWALERLSQRPHP